MLFVIKINLIPVLFKLMRCYCATLYYFYCLRWVLSRKHMRVMCGRGKALSLWNLDADASLSCWPGRRCELAADWKAWRYITSSTVSHQQHSQHYVERKKLVDSSYYIWSLNVCIISHLHFQHFYFKVSISFCSYFARLHRLKIIVLTKSNVSTV